MKETLWSVAKQQSSSFWAPIFVHSFGTLVVVGDVDVVARHYHAFACSSHAQTIIFHKSLEDFPSHPSWGSVHVWLVCSYQNEKLDRTRLNPMATNEINWFDAHQSIYMVQWYSRSFWVEKKLLDHSTKIVEKLEESGKLESTIVLNIHYNHIGDVWQIVIKLKLIQLRTIEFHKSFRTIRSSASCVTIRFRYLFWQCD